jgi:hypothetical protein
MVKKRGKAKALTMGNMELHRVAHYTFFVGLLLAIVAGIFSRIIPIGFTFNFLIILGLIVGLFNLTVKETLPFLVAAIALMLAGIVNLGLFDLFGLWPQLGFILRSVLSNIVVFVVPGAIIVGMKTIWKLASD